MSNYGYCTARKNRGRTESFKESMKKDYRFRKLNQWGRFTRIGLGLFDLELRDRIAFCKGLKEHHHLLREPVSSAEKIRSKLIFSVVIHVSQWENVSKVNQGKALE